MLSFRHAAIDPVRVHRMLVSVNVPAAENKCLVMTDTSVASILANCKVLSSVAVVWIQASVLAYPKAHSPCLVAGLTLYH